MNKTARIKELEESLGRQREAIAMLEGEIILRDKRISRFDEDAKSNAKAYQELETSLKKSHAKEKSELQEELRECYTLIQRLIKARLERNPFG